MSVVDGELCTQTSLALDKPDLNMHALVRCGPRPPNIPEEVAWPGPDRGCLVRRLRHGLISEILML